LFVFWRFFYFFRDPERDAPPGKNIVAPADGMIVYVKEVKNNALPISIKKQREIALSELTKVEDFAAGDKYAVGIFMLPSSVHVNRAPIAGEVSGVHYHKSKNLAMTVMWLRCRLGRKPYEKHARHILQNERNTVIIRGDFPLAVVQIADLYVRKIVCSVTKGQAVEKGQRIGMIRMGSQVDCIFPQQGMTIRVAEGQMVKAGETVLATYE
jgi:phosphatidylserine decarboxylase